MHHKDGGGARAFGLRGRAPAAALAVALALGVVGMTGQEASAQSPCGTNGVFSSGPPPTCTYTTTGEDTFTVPSGVTSIHVVTDGAAGASSSGAGGAGAQVTADVPVTPGSTLYVEVGVGGGPGGTTRGGAGGGESDLRTCSATSSGCMLTGDSADPRWLVGAGGGGGGGGNQSLSGGAGGVGLAYCNPGTDGTGTGGAGPGTGGTCTSGGTGGGGSAGSPSNGGSGTPGAGGSGGNFSFAAGGGGGGAGFWGGGGGGTGTNAGAGGGGGSSFAFASASNVSTVANPTGTPSVTISYTSPPSIVTTPSRTRLQVGTTVVDRATVTGNAQEGNPAASGATVTFFVCGPPATSCTSGGTAVGGPRPLTATSSTTATATSPPFRPTVAGTYCWRAEYSGNPNYAAVSADGSSECFTVRAKGGGGGWHWHDHQWYDNLSHPHR
ncbi:hypothetical protein ACWEWI_19355 [Streptomyces sp. NPDC003753]|uniref:hypothetical protein n=1 Tax=Streptomyces sp. Y2F8-2 TaxID=2759675 RepID=UPI0019047365|nr:hypothetical protein [Streptomyces sp. Y2F8-2]GHK03709.1 hypothetical protein SY2F82_55060 [Streptomyces sp. Y2F8-2]